MTLTKRFAASLGLNLLLVAVVLSMMGYPGKALNVGHSTTLPPASSAPTWTHALQARFPNCRDIDTRPTSVIPNEVVLIPLDGGKAYREDFAYAWAHRNTGQFFTVGYCR